MTGTRKAVDIREFARFVVVGVLATLGNIASVLVARFFMTFEFSLVAGIAVGLTTSFLLSKLFAFESHSWALASGEAARFIIVYSVSVVLYWGVAVAFARLAVAQSAPRELAETGGVLIGAGMMTLTSYFGHRFFTYRTFQRAEASPGRSC
jgi:putative flippase GtrA